MPLDDVFYIDRRGLIVTGLIARGTVTVGDELDLVAADGTIRNVTVKGLETFRKLVPSASAGSHIGILITGIRREEAEAGDVLRSQVVD